MVSRNRQIKKYEKMGAYIKGITHGHYELRAFDPGLVFRASNGETVEVSERFIGSMMYDIKQPMPPCFQDWDKCSNFDICEECPYHKYCDM